MTTKQKSKLQHAPIYTAFLTEFYNQLQNFYEAQCANNTDSAALIVNIEGATCTINITKPIYTQKTTTDLNKYYILDNVPVLNITTQEYDLTVNVNNNSRTCTIVDTKTNDHIYTVNYDELDSIKSFAHIQAHKNTPFMIQILTAYQVIKHISTQYKEEENLLIITDNLISSIGKHLEHIQAREHKSAQEFENLISTINSDLEYIINLDIEKETPVNDAVLQIESIVNGTKCITTLGKELSVTIIDPQDANNQYSIKYDSQSSTIVHVLDKATNNTIHKIPTFILDNTNFKNEEELDALRSTYNLYDSINTGYKVLKHFQHKGTSAISNYVDSIKQAYYSAIL